MTSKIAITGRRRLIPIVFLIGATLIISSGMAAVPAMALPALYDPQDASLVDFDIKNAFIDSEGALNIQLYGKAGGTVPQDSNTVYAYVVVTNDGIYATDSHEAQHTDDEQVANKAWHGHKVEILAGGGPNGRDCLVEIGSLGAQARMAGSNVKIIGAGATVTDIKAVVTTSLTLLHEHPDEVPEGECVAEVAAVPFDVALPTKLL